MRRLAHALARRALGPAYPRALRRWRRAQGAWRSRRVAAVTRRFVAWHGLEVSGGPFAGLEYPDRTPLSLLPKLLGIYERELHGAIEEAVRSRPEAIVNIGAADGYYAVGLALRCPGASVIAFEADPTQRALLSQVAGINHVPLQIERDASLDDLRTLAAYRTVFVVDCEGCEGALLDPDEVPLLRSSTIIVELHDFIDPGVGDAVVARFAGTHDIALIPTGPQPPARELALSEQRPGPMRWAVMTPRRAPRA
jgi:hypothetical protein